MQYLNFAFFLIFILFAILGFNKAHSTLHVCENGTRNLIKVTRSEYLIYYLTCTCILAFYSPGVVDLAALRLLVTEALLLLTIIVCSRGIRLTFAIKLYLLFIFWCFVSSLFCTYTFGFSIRTISKYFYPVLVFFAVSSTVKNEKLPLKISQDLIKVALLSICILFIPKTDEIFNGLFYYGTAITIFYISISSICLANFLIYKKRIKFIFLAIIFILPCLFLGYRTSLLANMVMLSVFALFVYKIRALAIIATTLILGISIIFLTPSIKEKMFFDSSKVSLQELKEGKVSIEQINSNGRFNTWEKLLARFYKHKKILGTGTGTTQGFMYSNKVFGGLTVPHNDYVTLLCDNGILGLVLYVLSYFAIIFQCFKNYNNKQNSPPLRFCAIVSGSSLSATQISMLTENVVNYSLATLTIPLVFYAMMMSLKWNTKK